MDQAKLTETINKLESSLNFILEHFRDGKQTNTMMERLNEIKRHTLDAKRCFDIIDNFAIIKPSN